MAHALSFMDEPAPAAAVQGVASYAASAEDETKLVFRLEGYEVMSTWNRWRIQERPCPSQIILNIKRTLYEFVCPWSPS